jgi:hypothetical protein
MGILPVLGIYARGLFIEFQAGQLADASDKQRRRHFEVIAKRFGLCLTN